MIRSLLATLLLFAAGCAQNGAGAAETIDVVSTDSTCEVAVTEAPAGTITFSVRNEGSNVTEFYLYGGNGSQVVGEVEDIGPGLTRSLTVEPEPGSYVTACKPGMVGDGIRGDFEVISD